MSKPRALIVAALEEQLPGVLVRAHGTPPEEILEDVVLVRLDSVVPSPDYPKSAGVRDYTGSLLAVSPRSTDQGEDDVDDLLEDVLHAIDRAPGASWTTAQRATLASAAGEDSWPAWEITVRYPVIRTP